MKHARLLIPSLAAFVVGAVLSPSGGRGALRRSVQEAETQHAAGVDSASLQSPGHSLSPFEAKVDSRLGGVLSALQEKSPLKRGHDLYEVVRGLALPDVTELVAAAEKIPEPYRGDVRRALLQRWFDLDASSGEAWVREHPKDVDAWSFWAERAPERALAELHAGIKDPKVADAVFEGALSLDSGDDKSRVEKIAALPTHPVRDRHLDWSLHSWSNSDPTAALAFSKTLPVGTQRKQTVRYALSVLAKRDPLRAMAMAGARLEDFQGEVGGEGASLADLAREASRKDRTAAMQWAAQLPEDRRAGPNLEIARVWAQTEPLAAIQWSASHGGDPSKLIADAMKGRPSDTLQWIRAQPEGPDRDRMLISALTADSKFSAGMSRADTASVLASIDQLSPDAQLQVARSLGSPGVDDGFNRSKAWCAALPEGPLRTAAIESAGAFYSRFPPSQAEQLLQQFPVGPSRDTALQAMVGAMVTYQTPNAADTALKISDPQSQQNTLDGMMPDWLHRDPDKAEAWIQKSTAIPPEWIAEWREESQWSTK